MVVAKYHSDIDALSLELFELGLRTATGRPAPKEYLRRLLRNPFYKGDVRYKKLGLTKAGQHPALEAEIDAVCAQHRKRQAHETEIVRARLKAIEEKRQRLLVALADGTLTHEAFRSANELVSSDEGGLTNRVALLERDLEQDAKRLRKHLALAEGFSTLYRSATPERRKELLHCLLARVYVRDGLLERVEWRPPFGVLVRGMEEQPKQVVQALVSYLKSGDNPTQI